MRYVQVPHTIQLKNLITKEDGERLTFRAYAYQLWLNDPRWESPKTNLLRLAKVMPEFEKLPGEWMELEDQDWAILKDIIVTPGTTAGNPNLFVPLVQVQVGPKFDGAVLDAPTKDPRVTLNGTATAEKAIDNP
jgi:hypothetical protein